MVDQTQLSGDNLQVTVYEVIVNLLRCIDLLPETTETMYIESYFECSIREFCVLYIKKVLWEDLNLL